MYMPRVCDKSSYKDLFLNPCRSILEYFVRLDSYFQVLSNSTVSQIPEPCILFKNIKGVKLHTRIFQDNDKHAKGLWK